MSAGIEKIARDGKEYALIVRSRELNRDREFVTEDRDPIQVGFVKFSKGTKVPAHYHKPVDPPGERRMEVIYVETGRVKVTIFDEGNEEVGSSELDSGTTLILMHGGHGFEFLEESRIVEIKQGPYPGRDRDKVEFQK